MFLGEIFQIQTQTFILMADPTGATKNWPDLTRVKNFWPGYPSLKSSLANEIKLNQEVFIHRTNQFMETDFANWVD